MSQSMAEKGIGQWQRRAKGGGRRKWEWSCPETSFAA